MVIHLDLEQRMKRTLAKINSVAIYLAKPEQDLLYEIVNSQIQWREGGCLSKDDVISILDKDGDLVAIIRKDMKSRKNVFYAVREMGMDELEILLKTEM